jgi:hypothetical protein
VSRFPPSARANSFRRSAEEEKKGKKGEQSAFWSSGRGRNGETYVVVDHKPQRVGDVALEGHQCRPIKVLLIVDLPPLERVANLRVLLSVDDGELNEGRDSVAFVAPKRALVGDRDSFDGSGAVEVGGLPVEEEKEELVRLVGRKGGRKGKVPHVEVFEERETVAVGETLRSGDPEVREETLDMKEH